MFLPRVLYKFCFIYFVYILKARGAYFGQEYQLSYCHGLKHPLAFGSNGQMRVFYVYLLYFGVYFFKRYEIENHFGIKILAFLVQGQTFPKSIRSKFLILKIILLPNTGTEILPRISAPRISVESGKSIN